MKVKHRTLDATIENAKLFFGDKDSVTLKEAWVNWGRDVNPENDIHNRNWFYNKMTEMKYHNIASPVYKTVRREKGVRKILAGIELTLEGKKLIGRFDTEEPEIPSERLQHSTEEAINANKLNFMDVMKLVSKWSKDNPEFDITFDIKLRREDSA